MISIAAGMAASLVGWGCQSLVGWAFGDAAGLLASLVVSTVVFVVARRWLLQLRDG